MNNIPTLLWPVAYVCSSDLFIIAAMAKVLDSQNYELWIEEEFKLPMLRFLMKRIAPIAELAIGVVLMVAMFFEILPYCVVIAMFALVCGQAWLKIRDGSCQCVGPISETSLVKYAPSVLLALAITVIALQDFRSALSRPTLFVAALIWFVILIIAFYHLVKGVPSKHLTRPPASAGNKFDPGYGNSFRLPQQLGRDTLGRPMYSADSAKNSKALVLVFLSNGCKRCLETIEDICIFSNGYRSLLRSFLFFSGDETAKGNMFSCDTQIVTDWRSHFSDLQLTGYPASIVCDAATGEAIGPVVYGSEKIRLLLAMTVSAARKEV